MTAYLTYIHPNFPFLSRKHLWKTHRSRHEEGESAANEAHHDHVVLQLVYAIGSRCLKLVGSEHVAESEPESLYNSAMAKVQDQLTVPSVQNIQIILLVAIYALRSPSGASPVQTRRPIHALLVCFRSFSPPADTTLNSCIKEAFCQHIF
jgi:hypothetical protein